MVNSMPNKGYKQTEEHKQKIGEANQISLKGKHCSPKTEFQKGNRINIGKKNGQYIDGRSLNKNFCKDCGKRILWTSKRCKRCWHKFNKGCKHGSHIPNLVRIYSVIFKRIRKVIRKRDNYRCQVCNKPQKNMKLDVHHIDYNKKNNNKKNLISLCKKCHMKTNHNRNYWYSYFLYLRKVK
jgi:5-methylcytosine-specific restriction endonuclease McrA